MAKKRTSGKRAEQTREREKLWRGILAEQKASGLSHTDFCRSKSISSNAYFWWKRELRLRDAKRRKARHAKPKKTSTPTLVPVKIRGTSPEQPWHFEVALANGRTVKVPAGFDAEALKRLVVALESETC